MTFLSITYGRNIERVLHQSGLFPFNNMDKQKKYQSRCSKARNIVFFYSKQSSSFSKPFTYITHDSTWPKQLSSLEPQPFMRSKLPNTWWCKTDSSIRSTYSVNHLFIQSLCFFFFLFLLLQYSLDTTYWLSMGPGPVYQKRDWGLLFSLSWIAAICDLLHNVKLLILKTEIWKRKLPRRLFSPVYYLANWYRYRTLTT